MQTASSPAVIVIVSGLDGGRTETNVKYLVTTDKVSVVFEAHPPRPGAAAFSDVKYSGQLPSSRCSTPPEGSHSYLSSVLLPLLVVDRILPSGRRRSCCLRVCPPPTTLPPMPRPSPPSSVVCTANVRPFIAIP